MISSLRGRVGAWVVLGLCCGTAVRAQVVSISDNFNDGNDVGWTHYAPISSPPYNGAAQWTFPSDGAGGFGYRIFGGPAVTQEPQYVGPARVGSFRNDSVLNDFFQAADILAFDPIPESVGFLAGRVTTPGLLTTRGYLVGYIHQGLNASQSAFFTLAFDSELTVTTPDYYHGGLAVMPNLDPVNGRYRMTFSGSGANLRGAIFDRTDLLEPIVRIAAFDAVHTSGVLGIGVLNQNDTREADYTFDNYHSITNANEPPAYPGVAQVIELTPAPNQLFYSPTGGISFRVRTFTTNQVATNAVRLFLNGSNVTAQLTITDQSLPILEPPRTHYLCRYTGLLPSNTIVQARIIANDTFGKGTTNNWTFDTFSSNGVTIIEAEDYNYGAGQFIDNPPVSGLNSNGAVVGPGGYYNRAGAINVDYFDTSTSLNANENQYRPDLMSTTQDRRYIRDTPRASHLTAEVGDYQVWEMEAGEWLNYTRTFTPARYRVYMRASSQAAQGARLDAVLSDPTQPNQSIAARGLFSVPNTGSSTRFRYIPLTDAFGTPQAVPLGGVNTIRLSVLQANQDLQPSYFLFIPDSFDERPPWVFSVTPTPGATDADPQQEIEAVILHADVPAAAETVQLFLDGLEVTENITVVPSTSDGPGLTMNYQPTTMWPPNSTHTARLIYGDDNGFFYTNQWSFTVSNLVTLSASIARPVPTGPRGFLGRIAKGRNDAPEASFPNSSARAEAHLAGTIVDPNSGEPYVNQAAGPNGDGGFTEPATINYEQAGVFAGYFGGELPFPNINPAAYGNDPNFIAMAATTYLELTPGVYRFGVRSDDGFKVTAGSGPTNQTLTLGVYEGGRGSSPTEFDFFVTTNGLYCFRLIYYEGVGGADVEWYSVNRISGARTLLNDGSGIPAYTDAGYRFTSITPAGNNVNLSFVTKAGHSYTIEYKNTLDAAMWSPLTNGVGTGGTVTIPVTRTNVSRFYRMRVD